MEPLENKSSTQNKYLNIYNLEGLNKRCLVTGGESHWVQDWVLSAYRTYISCTVNHGQDLAGYIIYRQTNTGYLNAQPTAKNLTRGKECVLRLFLS